jgi:hypothetical protein
MDNTLTLEQFFTKYHDPHKQQPNIVFPFDDNRDMARKITIKDAVEFAYADEHGNIDNALKRFMGTDEMKGYLDKAIHQLAICNPKDVHEFNRFYGGSESSTEDKIKQIKQVMFEDIKKPSADRDLVVALLESVAKPDEA